MHGPLLFFRRGLLCPTLAWKSLCSQDNSDPSVTPTLVLDHSQCPQVQFMKGPAHERQALCQLNHTHNPSLVV